MDKQKAFSLIELSIVAIIIGVLITGILQGQGLLKASRLANARAFTVKSPVPEIDGLIAWYETSLIKSLIVSETLEGSQTTTWYDSTPGSTVGTARKNTLTTTASSGVIYTNDGINNLPSISFSNAASMSLIDFYQGPEFSQTTLFLVFRPLTTPSIQVLVDNYSTDLIGFFAIKSNGIRMGAGSQGNTGTVTNPASFSIGNNYITAAYFNDTISQAFSNDAVDNAGGSTMSIGSNARSGITLGNFRTGTSTYKFTGLISEVIIYDRILKLSERKDVMNYLSKKYKISVTGL